jgi:glycine cleavage system aminomethyltransferase T
VSRAAGCAVGLAWVPAAQSKNGDQIEIHMNGRPVTAVINCESRRTNDKDDKRKS